MAVYYLSPYTQTNGVGSWANPYSCASSSRPTFYPGDELRIQSRLKTDLLLPTVYTAYVYTNNSVMYVSGGGGATDFAVGNIVYIHEFDVFFKIQARVGNELRVYTSYTCIPTTDWSYIGSSNPITIQKVNPTVGVASSTSGYYIFGTSHSLATGITVSDGWIFPEGTRVTDGSAVSLFHSSSTGNISFLPSGATSGRYLQDCTLDLNQSYFLAGNNTTTTASLTTYLVGMNQCTMSMRQVNNPYCGTQGVTNSILLQEAVNSTFNIRHMTGVLGKGISSAVNCTFNITYSQPLIGDIGFLDSYTTGSPSNLVDCTFNVDTILPYTRSSPVNGLFNLIQANGCTFNINRVIQYSTTAAQTLVSGSSNSVINLGPNFTYKHSCATGTPVTQTSFTVKSQWFSTTMNSGSKLPRYHIVPLVNNIPAGYTFTSVSRGATAIYNEQSNSSTMPYPFTKRIVCYADSWDATYKYDQTIAGDCNRLYIFRNGDSPVEQLSPSMYLKFPYTVTQWNASPIVTYDSVIKKTTGPSLKSYLGVYSGLLWKFASVSTTTVRAGYARKPITIAIPTSGGSVTVSGYVRNDNTAFENGDCVMELWFDNELVASQNMTTACTNNWEQFNLSFTPSKVGEATLVWKMYYRTAAKSFWLDDITVQ